MARRRRSFFFDNINKKLLMDTTKNTKDVKDDVDSAVVANTNVMTLADVEDKISTELSDGGYATQTYVNTANSAMKTYVDTEVAGVVDSAPGTLDTLNELAAALGDDANFATTTATSLGNRLRIDTNAQSLTSTQKTNAVTNLGLATVATSGAYSDLTGTPTIPTNNNQLTNGAGYITGITSSDVTTALGYTPGTSSFSGSYNDLTNQPTIPTNNNQLTNGAGYLTGITSSQVTTALGYTPGNLDHFRHTGTGYYTSTTTSDLLTEALGDDAFDSYLTAHKTGWSYAGNGNLTDAGRLTELAGSSWLWWTDNSGDNVQGNITALCIAPNTGGSAGKVFIYNNQGSGYSPGWREVWTSASDGSGSGLDADLWDGNEFASYINQALLTTSNVTHNQIIANSWLRATGEKGLYSQSYGQHFYPDSGGVYWDIDGPLRHRDGYEGTIHMYSGYHDGNGAGLLSSGGAWWINQGTLASDGSHIIFGGHTGANAFNTYTSRRIMIGGGNTDARDNYYIGTNQENKGGNYNKLDLRWHTGVRIGAQAQYGGTRIMTSEDMGGVALSVNNTVDHSGSLVRAGPHAGSQSGRDSAFEVLNNGGTGDANLANINFHCSGTYAVSLHLRPDSYFGVGGWSASTWRWYVQTSTGNMTAAGNITAYSDPRLKENITPLTGAIDKIKKLNGMEFTWKDLPDVVGTPGARDYGVLSTEVAEVAPCAVHESAHTSPDGDTYKTVAYDKLIPLLIEAVKEQQKEIDGLKARLS